MSGPAPNLATTVAGLTFQNPVVLAAGTAGYGEELAGVMRVESLGGIVTKAVSMEPRAGAPAPRVAEFGAGMLNAVGLANPGVEAVVRERLPWLASHLPDVRKLVNVVGRAIEDFGSVVRRIEAAVGTGDTGPNAVDGYELNVSCPNVKAGGTEFGADPMTLHRVVATARSETHRPIFVKLSPTLVDIAGAARVAVGAGADGITVVNTIPGMLIDPDTRRPVLGFGTGGVSGPALLPVGVLATWKVSRGVTVPVMGVGGVRCASDAVQYILAGASLVGVGTAALKNPRAPEHLVRDLQRWCERHDVSDLSTLRGALEYPCP